LGNKILYIYTENLNFFYRLNRELIRLNIKFEVLNIRNKIPSHSSIMLTTSDEVHNFINIPEKLKILPYSIEENFEYYILKVLAAVKIGLKDSYLELLFSIDPGTTQIGIVVFLDDHYLQAHTVYENALFMDIIKNYIICFQHKKPNQLKINFKLGRGVIPITIDLLKLIYNSYKNRKFLKVYLIDEKKSSKIKINFKNMRINTKHEISALILALRKGVEVNINNYLKIIKEGKSQNFNNNEYNILEETGEGKIYLKEVIDRLLINDIALSKASQLLSNFKSSKHEI